MTNTLTVTAPDGLPFIEYQREFDAPVSAVYRAHVDPDLLGKWLGPGAYEMDVVRHDATPGGSWRYVHRDGDTEYGFHGVFHTVKPEQLIIQTFEFEGVPDVVSIESLTFEALADGRTRLVGHSVYPSVEARDGMVASGMESGMAEGYDRLDDLLAEG